MLLGNVDANQKIELLFSLIAQLFQ